MTRRHLQLANDPYPHLQEKLRLQVCENAAYHAHLWQNRTDPKLKTLVIGTTGFNGMAASTSLGKYQCKANNVSRPGDSFSKCVASINFASNVWRTRSQYSVGSKFGKIEVKTTGLKWRGGQ